MNEGIRVLWNPDSDGEKRCKEFGEAWGKTEIK